MTANFTITDAELEAIRSVERFFGKKMQEDFLAPSIPHGLHEVTVARRCRFFLSGSIRSSVLS